MAEQDLAIPSVSDTYIGNRATIALNNSKAMYFYTLIYEYSSSSDETIISGTIASLRQGIRGEYWTLPYSIYDEMPKEQYKEITIKCKTYSERIVSGQIHYDLLGTKATTFKALAKASDCTPIIEDGDITITDINDITVAATGDNTKIIMGESNARINVSNITSSYPSPIEGYKIKVNDILAEDNKFNMTNGTYSNNGIEAIVYDDGEIVLDGSNPLRDSIIEIPLTSYSFNDAVYIIKAKNEDKSVKTSFILQGEDTTFANLNLGTENATIKEYFTGTCTKIIIRVLKGEELDGFTLYPVLTPVYMTSADVYIDKINIDKFTITAEDPRGFSATKEVTLNPEKIIDYVPLTCDAKIGRITSTSNQIKIVYSGDYYNGSFGGTNNSLTIEYDCKYPMSAQTIDSGTLTPIIDGNTFYGEYVLPVDFDVKEVYAVSITISDEIKNIVESTIVRKGIPIFDFGEDEVWNNYFNVNGSYCCNNKEIYPVGAIFITGTRTNPSNIFGGEWVLVDKEFAPLSKTLVQGTDYTINTTNTNTGTEVMMKRTGHDLWFRFGISNKVAITDTETTFLTLKFDKIRNNWIILYNFSFTSLF